jgi:hypothetical protein
VQESEESSTDAQAKEPEQEAQKLASKAPHDTEFELPLRPRLFLWEVKVSVSVKKGHQGAGRSRQRRCRGGFGQGRPGYLEDRTACWCQPDLVVLVCSPGCRDEEGRKM